MPGRLTGQLALEALEMVVGHRQPEPGLIHHSDRGSQYASADYQWALRFHGIICNMSRRGDCWDDGCAHGELVSHHQNRIGGT